MATHQVRVIDRPAKSLWPGGSSAKRIDDKIRVMDEVNMNTTDISFENYNILIVDDTPVNLSVVVEFLQNLGFGIRIARSGEKALERVRYNQPDIILLDVLMPGIDGYETCRQLKANDETKDIPVIFMTSLTGVEDKVRGFEVGAVDYVTKPLAQEEVLARITTHLRILELTTGLKAKHEQLKLTSQAELARLFEAVSQQREQLRTLTTRLTEVQELERKQLARELHDELGQALTAISINLSAIEKEVNPEQWETISSRLEESQQLTAVALEQIREMSLNLRPPMLDDLGLVPTLRWYGKRFSERVGIEMVVNIATLENRLSPETETALYRVVQEGLTNVARHANASEVFLTVRQEPGQVCVVIADNGQGFDLEAKLRYSKIYDGAGLLGIRERITLLGGVFDIQTGFGEGTKLLISIPV